MNVVRERDHSVTIGRGGGGTTQKTFRIRDDIWELLKAKAAREGMTASTVVRVLIQEYLESENESGDRA